MDKRVKQSVQSGARVVASAVVVVTGVKAGNKIKKAVNKAVQGYLNTPIDRPNLG